MGTYFLRVRGSVSDRVALGFIKRETQDVLVGKQPCLERMRRGLGQPSVELRLSNTATIVAYFFSCGNFCRYLLPTRSIFITGEYEDRSETVLGIAIFCPLGGITEKSGQSIVILHRDRVEFVIVALATIGRHTQINPTQRLHPICGVDGQILFIDGSPLVGRDIATLQPGRNQLVIGRIREHITGDLFNGELIEGLIGIERTNHPVAIRPHFTIIVEVHSVRVAITCRIKPIAGAVLAPRGPLHQSVDPGLHRCFGIAAIVDCKCLTIGWRRR